MTLLEGNGCTISRTSNRQGHFLMKLSPMALSLFFLPLSPTTTTATMSEFYIVGQNPTCRHLLQLSFSSLFAHLYHSRLNLPCLSLPFYSTIPFCVEDVCIEGLKRVLLS
ncbi:unnamed protein product [Coffea canephora]|uniref:Uncharacterized protein n=1 Tax=Coffea canephora TaxID=49390 RepID=A0A068TM01_COFCA|nr:unnamed protein product [Coffea canephora]